MFNERHGFILEIFFVLLANFKRLFTSEVNALKFSRGRGSMLWDFSEKSKVKKGSTLHIEINYNQ